MLGLSKRLKKLLGMGEELKQEGGGTVPPESYMPPPEGTGPTETQRVGDRTQQEGSGQPGAAQRVYDMFGQPGTEAVPGTDFRPGSPKSPQETEKKGYHGPPQMRR